MRKTLLVVLISIGYIGGIHLFVPFTSHGQGAGLILTAGLGTPTLDGMEEPGEWTSNQIVTSRGVTIKAMMDAENFYILATWPDDEPSVNLDHWTWDGEAWTASEDEDRIAFIWEMSENGESLNGQDGPSCQTMCHPGEGMSTRFGRVDVWHGKATRFLAVGSTDDKYWDTDGPDGRHSDSGGGSGDRNRNEEATGPEYRGAVPNPTFLLEDMAALEAYNIYGVHLGTASVKIMIGEADTFTEGETLPGRILAVPTGNRASVETFGRWVEGVWTWEFRRKLSGESDSEGQPEDFTAEPGGSVRFVSEIFNNLSEHGNHSFSNAGSGPADFRVYTLNFPLPTSLVFAHTGNGGGLSADHVFTNPLQDRTVQATMSVFDDEGAPLPIDIAAVGGDRYLMSRAFPSGEAQSTIDFEVPPLGAVTISSTGTGEVVDGAARVTANNLLGGVIRFSLPGVGIAGIGASTPLGAFIIPVRRIPGGINTGVAIHHPVNAQGAVVINLSLRDESGTEVASQVISDFPMGGHMADFIDEIFAEYFASLGDSEGFSGTLVATVEGGQVAAIALELGANPGEFTTLPVTPIP